MIVQESILGVLLGAHLGLDMAAGGQSFGLQVALRSLEMLAVDPPADAIAPELLRLPMSGGGNDSAEVLLSVLPEVFLGFADAPELLTEEIVRAITAQAASARVGNDALRGALAMATLLRSPFPSPIANFTDVALTDRDPDSPPDGGTLQALCNFCAAPSDYRSCLQRAAKDTKATAAMMALTGAFLGAYQGVLGIPLSWQLMLVRKGIWSQYAQLSLAVVAYYTGKQSWREGEYPPIAGPVGSLQTRAQLQMPSWNQTLPER